MILSYGIIANPPKLTKEMESINEKHRILYYDGYVELELFEIQHIEEFTENQLTGETELVREYYTRNGVEDTSFSISVIKSIIDNHDPNTPYITEDQQRILDLEMIIADMMGV